MDIIGNLPPELAETICMYLTPRDMYQIRRSFPRWLVLINNENFWRKKCKLDHFYPIEERSKSPFYKTFFNHFDYWQGTYFYNLVINYNWENNIFKEIPLTNVGQLNEINYFDDDMLIASDDYNIKIFNSSTGVIEKCFNTFYAGRILHVTKQNNILICVTDQSTVIWNIDTELVLTTLIWEGNVLLVRKVYVHRNLVAVNVRYCFNRQEEIFILDLGSIWRRKIRCVVTDVLLYSNALIRLQDLSINVVNLHNGSETILTCYSDDYHIVEKISMKNEYLIGLCKCSPDVHLSVWNIETLQLVTSTKIDAPFINPYVSRNLALFEIAMLDHNKLAYSFCENFDESIRVQVLNYISGERIFRIIFYNNASFCRVLPSLKAWNNNILSISLSSSGDFEYIRMFCPNTGKLIKTRRILLHSSVSSSADIMFTRTKMLEFKFNDISEPEPHRTLLNILNFEK